MYSWEIEKLIREKEFLLDIKDCLEVTDPTKNPQVSHVKYDSSDDSIELDTSDNYHFKFKIKTQVDKNNYK